MRGGRYAVRAPMASRCRQQPAKSPAKGEPPKPTAAAAITNTQMTPEESADAMKTRYASMEIGEPKPVAIKVETEIIEHEVEWRNPPTQDQMSIPAPKSHPRYAISRRFPGTGEHRPGALSHREVYPWSGATPRPQNRIIFLFLLQLRLVRQLGLAEVLAVSHLWMFASSASSVPSPPRLLFYRSLLFLRGV